MLTLLLACSPTVPPGAPTPELESSGDSSPESAPPASPTACEGYGLPTRAWNSSGTLGELDAVAPDFSLTRLDGGTLTYSELYTGCETVIVVVDRPSISYPNLSQNAEIRDWVETSPLNVHWVFFSEENSKARREEALTELQEKLLKQAEKVSDEAALWAIDHLHFVPSSTNNTDTWIDALFAAYGRGGVPFNFGIDRFQRVRELGYLADPITGWATAPPRFLNYEAEYFNAEAALQDRLDADGATVLRLFTNSTERLVVTEMPDAATMATFDTLELDMSFICGGHPDATYCGEWDYLAYAYLCDNDDPTTTDVDESGTCVEIARWITAYARPGRWVVDASAFLAKLSDGGPKTFRVDSSNAPYITLDLRLSNQGKGLRPVALTYLWGGGSFDSAYNSIHEAVSFTVPAGATHVGLTALITGHGYGQDTENCAEFCNHQHQFTVNDRESWMLEFPTAGTNYGCAEQIAEGTVPNQYGTWVLGRGGWCPGKQVDPFVADLSTAVDLGGENTVSYLGLFEGATYEPVPYNSGSGFGAGIVANTWLVFYEEM